MPPALPLSSAHAAATPGRAAVPATYRAIAAVGPLPLPRQKHNAYPRRPVAAPAASPHRRPRHSYCCSPQLTERSLPHQVGHEPQVAAPPLPRCLRHTVPGKPIERSR
ncbi:MAG: hypothetical protein SNJ50_21505 [Cyanobacteriota bacterium]